MRKPRVGTVILVLWALFLTGAVTIYLTYLQPSRLGRTVSEALESTLGTPASIKQVDFFLFPHPAVHIYGLKVEQGGSTALEFRADSCSAQLSWFSLLRFRPVVRAVDLKGPVFDIALPERSLIPLAEETPPEPARVVEMAMPEALPVLSASITGIRIRINNGIIRVRQASTETQVLVNGINGSARLPGLFSGNVDLAVRNTTMRFGRAPAVTLSGFSLRATSLNEDAKGDVTGTVTLNSRVQMESLERTLGHPVPEAYRYFPLPEPAHLTAALDVAASSNTGLITVSGKIGANMTLPMNGHATPVSLLMPFSMQSFEAVDIENMILTIGKDSGVISGTLTGLARKDPVLTGYADIQHFSLTHWFGFGRRMTAGLQLGLDNISGNLDFVLTPRGIHSSRLEARVLDTLMTGSGGCEDFRKPVVVIDGHTNYANLNPLFPEINGIKTPKPDLPPPAVPINEEDDGKPAKVGFRINLRADAVDIHKLQAGDVVCLISPINDPYGPPQGTDQEGNAVRPEKSGAKLDIAIGNLYGGTLEALTILEEPYRINATATGVEMEDPIARLTGFKALGGTLNATSSSSFFGSSPAEMIGNLDVSIDGTMENGFFGSKNGHITPYRRLSLNAAGKAVPGEESNGDDIPEIMDFKGLWEVTLDTVDFSLGTKAETAMTFDMRNGLPKSMAPHAIPVRLTLHNTGPGQNARPGDINLELKGEASFDLDAGTASFQRFNGGRKGLILSGSLSASNIYEDLTIAGPVTLKTAILDELTPLFGWTLPRTAQRDRFKLFTFESLFQYSPLKLSFDKIVAHLDDTPITGSLSATTGTRHFWTGSLQLGSIDGDSYWPDNDSGPPSPIPEDMLSAFDMDVRLYISKFTLFGSPVQNLTLPIQLTKGKLSTGVFTGSFADGGTLTGSYLGEVTPPVRDPAGKILASGNLTNRLQIRINDLNMLPVTRSRQQETLISGTGFCQADIQARLQYWSDIPKALDGNWGMQIRDGYLVGRQEEDRYVNAPTTPSSPQSGFGLGNRNSVIPNHSPRTPFQMLSASGNILAGVLHSNDFLLKGTILTVKGSGSVNLNAKTINASAVATLLGVPEVPIEISGSLENPKTSYKVVGAVTGTVGNIAEGFVDMISGIVTAPFRLFKR